MKPPKPYDHYDHNVYRHPETWGMEQVAAIDYSSGCYEFNYRVVWKDEKGVLWSGRDSGCSCPTPFEDFTEESDFERVTRAWITHVLEPELNNESGKEKYRPTAREEYGNFLWEVKKALRAKR